MAQRVPTKIDRFLGLNESDNGNLQLQLGEASMCQNWRITDDYKLKKVDGYQHLFDTLGAYSIKGMWYGKISGSYHLLFACNGHIYKHDLSTHLNSDLGTLADATTNFIGFGTAVYIINGTDYYKWTGTSTIAQVTGYIPLVYTATPPAGGGTANEQINLLTGKKHQTFSGDNTATVYQLVETAVTSIDSVYVGGVLKTLTTDYTVDLTAGTVTFGTKPATGVDNVDIYWTKGSGSRAEITDNKYMITYGGKNDTRVFVYGDGSNRYYYTGLAAGVPSAEYFPVLNYRDIGSSEYKITDLMKQYDRLIIFKENESWFSGYEAIDDGNGNLLPDFPTYPLNDVKGNIPMGQSRLINNNPFTIMDGVYNWNSTAVRDERNATYISKRVQYTLDSYDLSSVVTCDFEYRAEYCIASGLNMIVYNYRNDTWYKLLLADTPTCFVEIDNELYFGTTAGQIMRFVDGYRSFDGDDIDAEWHMGFYAAGAEWIRKYLNKTWITMLPQAKASLDVTWATNKDGVQSATISIEYNNFSFSSCDFTDFTFHINYNPQPFLIKTKVKKWVYIKFVFKNNSATYTATVLSLNLIPKLGGETK